VAARTNPSIRVAVAAADESIRILSLYYEGESSDSPWEQQVFDTLAEAQKWARGDC
jgi:basic membrane lipoprotein Med (substrate-binding protein (PBP1-ABC) superfamily)